MRSNPEPFGLTRRRLLGSAAMAATGALALAAVDLGAARPARAAGWPTGLDANTDPDPGAAAAAGYTFISYYTNGPGSMTAAKVAACAAKGVAVIANYEGLENPTSGGSAAGKSNAQTALAAANDCGLPGDRPIYFSLDFDVLPSQFSAVDAYLDGVASVLPPSRIGVYSSTWCIDHLVGNGKATWFWQSKSTGFSGGHNGTLNPHTHIWQQSSPEYVYIGDKQCDWNYVITADFGQWGISKPYATTSQLVAVGNDGNVYHDIRNGTGTWQGWRAVAGYEGGATFAAPGGVAIAGAKGGSSQLVAIGNGNGLYHNIRHTDSSWQGWAPLGLTGSQCAIAAMPDGSAQVLAVDGSGNVTHNIRYTSGSWQGFSELPGTAGGAHFQVGRSNTGIAITGMPDGSSQVLAYGNDNAAYHNIRYGNGTWQGWKALPGAFNATTFSGSAFAIAGMGDGSAQLLAIGNDGNLYHNIRYPNGTWQGWRSMGFAGHWVSAGTMPDGSLQVLAAANDGTLYHNIRFTPSGNWQGFRAVQGANGAATFNGTHPGITGFFWG
ncbi:glycoside hydrolase domain-containing protein [Nonomuraea sp. NPDC050536]|uniref:glycoside hydrolase domain-containing protein n=1 Tax=Nonomuraea sp. NPDC050536 TaxID=3364366 RepID=UPI0037CB8E93